MEPEPGAYTHHGMRQGNIGLRLSLFGIIAYEKAISLTWSPIKVIHAGDAAPTTIGNAAPIVVGSDIVLLLK